MVITGTLKKHHRKALEYFGSRLLSPQMSRNVSVKIVFKKHMDNLGMCYVDGYNLADKPREFIIEIKRDQDDDELLNTFAHEMVHVYQYCYGLLNEGMTKWCGKDFDRSKLKYSEYPWEIEAYATGERLANEFTEKE